MPHGRWKTTTVVAALTLRGMVAPFVLAGPINGEAFEAYVERVLAPCACRSRWPCAVWPAPPTVASRINGKSAR